MANVKNKVKTRQSVAKRVSNTKQSSTGSKDELKDIHYVTQSFNKNKNNIKFLTDDEKVQICIKKDQVLREKLKLQTIKDRLKNNRRAKSTATNSKFLHDKTPLSEQSLLKKSHNKKKNKCDRKLLDDILKSELLIKDSKNEQPVRQKTITNNNNDITLTDQNTDNEDIEQNQVISHTEALPNKKTNKNITKVQKEDLQNSLDVRSSVYICDYCQRSFTTKFSLQRHVVTHLTVKTYHCSDQLCEKTFTSRKTMTTHLKRCHKISKPERYVCQICDKSFLMEKNFLLHISNHVKSDNAYKCVYCEKEFSYHLMLIQHEKTHLVDGRYHCSICSKNYSCRNQLYCHIKSHLNLKEYICQYCGKEFLRDNSMKRHVEIFHGGQRIQCPICKKKLKGHLTEHMRTHEKMKPHECPECGMRFTQSTQLTVHRRSHTGARPYPCRICNRPFTLSNALMLHIRRHTGERPFTCTMCPLTFSQLPHMKNHLRTIHGEEYPYKCNKCNLVFKKRLELDNHTSTCKARGKMSLKCDEEIVVESTMTLTRMRFLLALLLTMIATDEKLKCLGFNKRLIDHILDDSLEAMGQPPCKDEKLSPLIRLRTNIQLLINRTVPQDQMEKIKYKQKTTEEILELLTNEKNSFKVR